MAAATVLPASETVGQTIPPDTPHAVSVSLPTWAANVGYEKGEAWVVDKMQCGYPRFMIHPSIARLADAMIEEYGRPEAQKAMLFPTVRCAVRCQDFLLENHPDQTISSFRILNLACPSASSPTEPDQQQQIKPHLAALIYPNECWPFAKIFWQHTGEGISSRRAEFCHKAFDEKQLVEVRVQTPPQERLAKGPRRYQRGLSTDSKMNGSLLGAFTSKDEPAQTSEPTHDCTVFVEERFGRNLDVRFAAQAKLAVRRRIAGSLTSAQDLPEALEQPLDNARQHSHAPADDVFLFSTGMNAIFTSHRILRLARGEMKSIMYGFPYVDTLKILEKWGPGAVFYGHCSSEELDDFEKRLEQGERFLSLYCEFPGNPLLMSPDLQRIRRLADKYDFAVVVDETIGNFLNVHVLPYADIVVSSLTKIFSGDSNVMGGCMILNPQSQYYARLREVLDDEYEDNHFEEDSVYLERNSRDFVDRIQRVNKNAEAVADLLRTHPRIKQVHYPKYGATKPFYDSCKLSDGGYGGLLSATFHTMEDAEIFYDQLDAHKGPSLGTNFTLVSPFVILAHFTELDWAASYGCEASLVRFSIGLEDTDELVGTFKRALQAITPS